MCVPSCIRGGIPFQGVCHLISRQPDKLLTISNDSPVSRSRLDVHFVHTFCCMPHLAYCIAPHHFAGSSVTKSQDAFPSKPCAFEDTSGIASEDVTRCADWESASAVLQEKNNTAANPCRMPTKGGEYPVPRIVVRNAQFEWKFKWRFKWNLI